MGAFALLRSALTRAGVAIAASGLYALSIAMTGVLVIPGADNIQLRPGVIIPIVCGVFFGPVVGFLVGAVGTLIADSALGWGWWPFWYVGSGCMGLASGLMHDPDARFQRLSAVLPVMTRAAVGIVAGMALASLSEYWVTQSSWHDIVWVNFVPAALSNLVTAGILLPIGLLLFGHLHNAARPDRAES
jgi:uncharacterized membrane protein